ncbi:hypothetical protein CYY_003404 [Polysphondylium violaceum]|uniref:Ankyrin repeat-containing protein n=1 Tax=Polysphondylium violaceum TaxID=133409 RepID=A0A8J4PXQ5_9MYCE|nr:hypothetical protein CYY_003404 [Polysphondylium violaceum]
MEEAKAKGYKEISDVIINSDLYLSDAQKKAKLVQCNELIRASRMGNLDSMRMAVQSGAMVDYKTCGYSALGYCCFYGYRDCVEWLVTEGKAFIDIPSSGNETSPLGVALEKGFNEIVDILLSNGASPTARDKDGKSLFYLAIVAGNLEVVKKLYETGMIEPDKDTDAQGNTLIHFAYKSPQIIDYLHNEVNLPLSMQNEQNKTVLHRAVVYKCKETVKYLVSNAPTMINTQDSNGYTALHYAVFYELLDIVKVLIKGEARLDIQEYSRFITPLELAKTRSNRMIIRYLQKSDPNNTEELVSLKDDSSGKKSKTKKEKIKKEKVKKEKAKKEKKVRSGRMSTLSIEREKLKEQLEKERKKKSSSETLFEDIEKHSASIIKVPPGGIETKKRKKARSIEEIRSNLTLTSRRNRKTIHEYDFEDINKIEEILDNDDLIEVSQKENSPSDDETGDEEDESEGGESGGESDGHLINNDLVTNNKGNTENTNDSIANDSSEPLDTTNTNTNTDITATPTTTTTTTTTTILDSNQVKKRGRPKRDPNAPPKKKKSDDDDFEEKEEEEQETDESEYVISDDESYSLSQSESEPESESSGSESESEIRATRPSFTSTQATESSDEESDESEELSEETNESDESIVSSTNTNDTTTTTTEQPPTKTSILPPGGDEITTSIPPTIDPENFTKGLESISTESMLSDKDLTSTTSKEE